MLDTKGNESKEQSFAERLNQISQGENEKEKAQKLLDSLIEEIKANRQECIDKIIEEACVEVRDKLENKVKLGEFVIENGKKRAFTYYKFVDSVFMPLDFEIKVGNACKKLECIFDNAFYLDIMNKKLTSILHGEIVYCAILSRIKYIVCRDKVEYLGFFRGERLKDGCVSFTEKLQRLLGNYGIKLEGIVYCSNNDSEYLSEFMKIDHKTKIKDIHSRGNLGTNPLLKFSVEF